MSTSKLQRRVSYMLSVKLGRYTIRENVRPDWLISPDGARLELDFYIEELSAAIEVQGEQHYRFVPRFHKTQADFTRRLALDQFKRDTCRAAGIHLYEVADEADAIEAVSEITTAANRYGDPVPGEWVTRRGRKWIPHQPRANAILISLRKNARKYRTEMMADNPRPDLIGAVLRRLIETANRHDISLDFVTALVDPDLDGRVAEILSQPHTREVSKVTGAVYRRAMRSRVESQPVEKEGAPSVRIIRSVSIELLDAAGLIPESYTRGKKGGWHGPCPACGGKSRFSIYIHPETGKALYQCAKCGIQGGLLDLRNALVFMAASTPEVA